jgi:3-oxoacyl-[acyl-carrier protein] reductase
MSRLENRRALVTGGSRGIGAAIARQLAAEGAHVAITYQTNETAAAEVVGEIKKLGRRGHSVAADAGDARSSKIAIETAVMELGGLDILVNNAGIFEVGSLDDFSLEDIKRNIDVNIGSVVLNIRAAIPHLGPNSRIINIGSCLATRVPGPGIAVYAMTKAALIGLTKGLARDLGANGTTVNIVHPGPTDTDMNPAAGEGAEGERQRIALGHFGAAQDIAATVAFLASADGRQITGAELAVDGGINI